MFTIRNLSLILILAAILGSGWLYAQTDPVAARLNVEGEIEIGANNSLRLRPVVGAAPVCPPACPEVGDLFFNGTTLSTWDGAVWQAFAESGTLIYSDTTNTLFFHNGTDWINLGGAGGPRTVATRIVAANNSLDKSRADYVCDGTNDQEQINQAINDLPVAGGAVYLLEGTYNISSSLLAGETVPGVVLDKNNTSLIGAGEMTVLRAVSGQTGFNIISAQSVNSLLISQLRVDGNAGAGGDNGISFNTVTDSRIEKVWVESTQLSGIVFSASTNNVISNCNIPFAGITGIILNSGSNNNIISGNYVQDFSEGLSLSSSANNIIRGNHFLSSLPPSTIGIRSSASPSNIISENHIQFCDDGIQMDNPNNNILTGNIIYDGQQANGINLLNGGSLNIISGNHLRDTGGTGIQTGSAYSLICANYFLKTDTTWTGGGQGIVSGGDANLISSNYISNSIGAGMGIILSGVGNYLSGNLIFDATPTDGIGYLGAGFDNRILDSGTNTRYTDKQKMTMERRQIDISSFPSDLWQQTISGHSYLALNPTVNSFTPNIRLYKGNAAGDLLILENISSFPVDILESAVVNWQVNLGNDNNDGDGDSTKRRLSQYDTLELIWNGTKWIEVRYSNN